MSEDLFRDEFELVRLGIYDVARGIYTGTREYSSERYRYFPRKVPLEDIELAKTKWLTDHDCKTCLDQNEAKEVTHVRAVPNIGCNIQ